MVAYVLNPLAGNVTTEDFSLVVGATPVIAIPNGALLGRNLSLMRIWNVSTSATIWLSRNGQPAAVNTAGSFPIGPGQYELWTSPQAIPVNGLSIVSTAANTPVTIEVG
jgi:hypothetical protein